MPKAKPSKSAVFSVRTCRYCGKKTRGPAHFRHEQACASKRRGRRRTRAARARGRHPISARGHVVRGARPTGQFFEQLRRLVQQELQRRLGFPASRK